MSFNVGINGFGRIGRNVLRAFLHKGPKNINVVAVNDISDAKTLGHLFKYDSVLGSFPGTVATDSDFITVHSHRIRVLKESLETLDWQHLNVDYVIEATGLYTDAQKAAVHLHNGAKKVIISAPAKNEDLTIVMGVNDRQYHPEKHHLISNASCTTNCLAPVLKVVHQSFGVRQGIMTTVHAYTNDQKILDQPHTDLRRSRAAGLSMIPTTTGAAQAVGRVLPELQGRLTGMAIRVPTPNVSLVDLSVVLDQKTSKQQLHQVLQEASKRSLKGILEYCQEPLVSTDFKNNPHSGIIDSLATLSPDEAQSDFFKLLVWYDNEWGYSCRIVDLIGAVASAEQGKR